MSEQPQSGAETESDDARETHLCRTCGGEVAQDAPTFPFCGDRCRNVDLGRWFDGEYRVSREIKDSDIETVD